MKKFILCLIIIFQAGLIAFADDLIYKYPANILDVEFPQYSTVSCKFNQTKTIPGSGAFVNSGGDFTFDIKNGAVFETLYPFKSTTAYTSDKRISDIILAVSKKDYSYINKNFDVFYLKNNQNWQLALKPKNDSKIKTVMESIVIYGNKYIEKLEINTVKRGSTKINFTECK